MPEIIYEGYAVFVSIMETLDRSRLPLELAVAVYIRVGIALEEVCCTICTAPVGVKPEPITLMSGQLTTETLIFGFTTGGEDVMKPIM